MLILDLQRRCWHYSDRNRRAYGDRVTIKLFEILYIQLVDHNQYHLRRPCDVHLHRYGYNLNHLNRNWVFLSFLFYIHNPINQFRCCTGQANFIRRSYYDNGLPRHGHAFAMSNRLLSMQRLLPRRLLPSRSRL